MTFKELAMKLQTFLASLTAFSCLQNAHAVYVAQDGIGQALIYSYYTANGDHDTLFSVVNPHDSPPKAVKVRFFEGRNGRRVLEFNLYLAASQTWTAAMTGGASPILRSFEPACTVPQFAPSPVYSGATEIPFTNADYAGYDQAGSGLDRAMEGHFEVIEMGEINESFVLVGGKTFGQAVSLQTQDCAAIAAAWNPGGAFLAPGSADAGLKAPSGKLLGRSLIINVPQGTEYSTDPVALGQLFAAPRHTSPTDAHPNLGDADPVSFVTVNGTGRQSTWIQGINAVSAVLMHTKAINEYVGPPTPESPGATDVILTLPTKSFYVVRTSDYPLTTRPPFSAEFDDTNADGNSTGACEDIRITRYTRAGAFQVEENLLLNSDPVQLCWQTNVISLGDVIESSNAVYLSEFKTTSGTIEFSTGHQGTLPLISIEGHVYTGLPMIGFTLQRYIHGDLGGVRANYGGSSLHKYETEIQ
jgi:hypothetical protein